MTPMDITLVVKYAFLICSFRAHLDNLNVYLFYEHASKEAEKKCQIFFVKCGQNELAACTTTLCNTKLKVGLHKTLMVHFCSSMIQTAYTRSHGWVIIHCRGRRVGLSFKIGGDFGLWILCGQQMSICEHKSKLVFMNWHLSQWNSTFLLEKSGIGKS